MNVPDEGFWLVWPPSSDLWIWPLLRRTSRARKELVHSTKTASHAIAGQSDAFEDPAQRTSTQHDLSHALLGVGFYSCPRWAEYAVEMEAES